jgi:hypothetical protein
MRARRKGGFADGDDRGGDERRDSGIDRDGRAGSGGAAERGAAVRRIGWSFM